MFFLQDVWYGDSKIYCILVLSRLESDVQSLVGIARGGVNHTFVEMEFWTDLGQPLDYDVKVYAKELK